MTVGVCGEVRGAGRRDSWRALGDQLVLGVLNPLLEMGRQHWALRLCI